MLRERGSTFTTEVLAGLIRSSALRTQACERGGAFRTELAPFAIVSSALGAAHVPRFALALAAQLVQQRLGVLQVGGVEALGEPVVDLGEHSGGLVALASLRQ